MAYNPPEANSVNFVFVNNYTPPSGDNVDLLFGDPPVVTLDNVSRSIIYDDQAQLGFHTSVVKWHTSESGPYRIEIGGVEALDGYLVASGTALTGITMVDILTDSDIEAAPTFSGTGNYEFNVYVYSESSSLWTFSER